jgi:DinB superfamily
MIRRMAELDSLKYPIGTFTRLTAPLDRAARDRHIDVIEALPSRFRALVTGLSTARWDTPYRPGGWTIRQVVHHVPDSHVNAYIRMRCAVTEEAPAIKTYEEQLWAELPDIAVCPPEVSLAFLEALHRRWVYFLRALPESAFARTYRHPQMGPVALDEAVALYSWHSLHHTAHIEQALRIAD